MGELEEEILVEKEHISTTLRALEETMKRDDKTVIELAAIATFLQNTYNGIENILKRILKFKNISIPRSETYHKNLLDLSVEHHIISLELCPFINLLPFLITLLLQLHSQNGNNI